VLGLPGCFQSEASIGSRAGFSCHIEQCGAGFRPCSSNFHLDLSISCVSIINQEKRFSDSVVAERELKGRYTAQEVYFMSVFSGPGTK
jgi:hypothetical protein